MTDFIDDDLAKRQEPRSQIRLAPQGQPMRPVPPPAVAPPAGYHPQPQPAYSAQGYPQVQQAPMRSARPQEQVEDQVASAMKELERLRQRQENLETQKQDLEELRRKQKEFEQGKRELVDALSSSLITLEKEEIKLEQLSNLLSTTRGQFKGRLAEIEANSEERWGEDNYREELNKALALIEDTRALYRKAKARISSLQSSHTAEGQSAAELEAVPLGRAEERNFLRWMKMGLAFSLPFVIIYALFALLDLLYKLGAL